MTHPSRRLDDTIHQRARLGILAVLSEVKRVDFAYMRETLALTDGNLSRHLQVLEEAGLVTIAKTFEKRRPRTWISATPQGRRAFAAEIAALREIVERFDDVRTPIPAAPASGRSVSRT